MSQHEIAGLVFVLIPLGLIVLGWCLLWMASWKRRQASSSTPFDSSPIALTVGGVSLMLLGLFAMVILTTYFLAIVVIPVMVVVLVAAFIRYRQSEVRYLIWNLAEAADHGIPLVKAARAFAGERGGHLAYAARRLADYLEAAMPLSLALARSGLSVAGEVKLAADIGEHTGTLGPSLKKAVEQSNSFEQSIGSVTAKFIYLSWIAFSMCGIVTFLMISIVPTFEEMFNEFGLELPAVTQLVMAICRAVVMYWYVLVPLFLLFVLVGLVGLISYIGISVQSLPIIRAFFRPIDSATVLHSLSIAVQQKQTIPNSLLMLANLARAPGTRHRLDVAVRQVSEGTHWCGALQQAGFISRAQGSVIKSAERAGNLAWALDEMADSSIRRTAQRAHAALNILFPSLLVGFGFSVFLVAVGILAPLFSLISSLA